MKRTPLMASIVGYYRCIEGFALVEQNSCGANWFGHGSSDFNAGSNDDIQVAVGRTDWETGVSRWVQRDLHLGETGKLFHVDIVPRHCVVVTSLCAKRE